MDLANVIIILLLVVLIIVFLSNIVVINNPNPPIPPPKPKPKPLIGGCKGTRYGCCPNSNIAKLNRIGTNCRYN
jgi:hypothetical protein